MGQSVNCSEWVIVSDLEIAIASPSFASLLWLIIQLKYDLLVIFKTPIPTLDENTHYSIKIHIEQLKYQWAIKISADSKFIIPAAKSWHSDPFKIPAEEIKIPISWYFYLDSPSPPSPPPPSKPSPSPPVILKKPVLHGEKEVRDGRTDIFFISLSQVYRNASHITSSNSDSTTSSSHYSEWVNEWVHSIHMGAAVFWWSLPLIFSFARLPY